MRKLLPSDRKSRMMIVIGSIFVIGIGSYGLLSGGGKVTNPAQYMQALDHGEESSDRSKAPDRAMEVDPSKARTVHSTPAPTPSPTPAPAAVVSTPSATPAPMPTVISTRNINCDDPYSHSPLTFKVVMTNYSDGTSVMHDLNGNDVSGKCVIKAGTW